MILKTKRLLLRSWQELDAKCLYEYAKSPEIGPIAGWPPHKSVEESLEVIKHVLQGAECYAICLQQDNLVIGAIELKLNGSSDMTERDDECELGYWIGYPFWGNGYVTEAAKEMIRHAFLDLDMRTIWCGYYDGNRKSKRVQEKCGFLHYCTTEDLDVPLMGEKRTRYMNILTKERWKYLFSTEV